MKLNITGNLIFPVWIGLEGITVDVKEIEFVQSFQS